MIYYTEVISWCMQLLQELFSTGIYTRLLLYIDPIMFGFMNINIVSPYKTITPQVLYYFNNILKLIFIIQTSSTWFHVKLILHPLRFVIQQFSHIKLFASTYFLGYPPAWIFLFMIGEIYFKMARRIITKGPILYSVIINISCLPSPYITQSQSPHLLGVYAVLGGDYLHFYWWIEPSE